MFKKNNLIRLRTNFIDTVNKDTKDFLKVSPYIDKFAFSDKKTVAEILDVSWWINYWSQLHLLKDVIFDKVNFKVKEKIHLGIISDNLETSFLFCRLLTGKVMPKKGLSSGRLTSLKKIKLFNYLDSNKDLKPGKTVDHLINHYLSISEKNINPTELASLITQFGLQEILFKHINGIDKINLIRLKIFLLMIISEKIFALEELWNKLPSEHRVFLINPILEFANKYDLTILLCSELDFEINSFSQQIIYLKNKNILISLPAERYHSFFGSIEQVTRIIK